MASPTHFKHQQLHNFDLPELKWATSSPTSTNRHRRMCNFKSATLNDVGSEAKKVGEMEKMKTKKVEATPMDELKKNIVIRLKMEKSATMKANMKDHVLAGDKEKRAKVEDCVLIYGGKDVKKREEAKKKEKDRKEEEPLTKTWNFRPRELVTKAKEKNNNNAYELLEIKGSAKMNKEKKLSISLSKWEIEDDFLAMTGSKPSKKPKKRNRTLQRKIDYLFPGNWLPSITLNTYKFNEDQPHLKM